MYACFSPPPPHLPSAMLVGTVFIYICELVGIGLMYGYFTRVGTKPSVDVWLLLPPSLSLPLLQVGSCSLNIFFITSTLIFGVGVSVIAILPWIQRG